MARKRQHPVIKQIEASRRHPLSDKERIAIEYIANHKSGDISVRSVHMECRSRGIKL